MILVTFCFELSQIQVHFEEMNALRLFCWESNIEVEFLLVDVLHIFRIERSDHDY